MSKAPEKLEVRVNGEITAPMVRLIDQDGKQAGVVSLREAVNAAREKNLDLVEVSPQASPPVCRILDWGKYHYTQMKRAREARRAHQVTEMKEVRLRPKTNEYHAGFKVDDARRFLKKKMKVKFKVQFRGREITYPEIALRQLQEVAETLSDIADVEQKPNLDGRTMVMVLTPRGELLNRKADTGDDEAAERPAAKRNAPAKTSQPADAANAAPAKTKAPKAAPAEVGSAGEAKAGEVPAAEAAEAPAVAESGADEATTATKAKAPQRDPNRAGDPEEAKAPQRDPNRAGDPEEAKAKAPRAKKADAASAESTDEPAPVPAEAG